MDTATPSDENEFRQADASFAASIPDGYERRLVPLFFEPYAADLRDRLIARSPSRVLELAAGTGVVTRAIAAALPDGWIVATDLNQAMIDIAARVVSSTNVQFQQADAMMLPFDGAAFDAVVAQFGVMFFPDKVTAFSEARRVLRRDGTFIFSVWGDVAHNSLDDVICATFAAQTGERCFLERVPHAYYDLQRIESDLRKAGFTEIATEVVEKTTAAVSAMDALDALIEGSPLGNDFERLGARAAVVRNAIIEELTAEFGTGQFTNDMSALVITAS